MTPLARINKLGWSAIASLAAIYVITIVSSLLLVGFLTTRSWQAAFLGIGWATIAGFELGLLVIVLLGFGIALASSLIFNSIRRRRTNEPEDATTSNPPLGSFRDSWAFGLLAACLVLPALALIVLRASAAILPSGRSGPAAGSSGDVRKGQPLNLGPAINTASREAEPSFTADGQTMYFNCHNGDICVSHHVGTWERGTWTSPERLASPISTEYEEVEPVINATGDKLYFTSIRPTGLLRGFPLLSSHLALLRVVNTRAAAKLGRALFGGMGLTDIYVSYKVDGAWTDPQSINDVAGEPAINTPFEDHCPFFSADRSEVFWTSTRPGGLGGNDIWTSRRVEGVWTVAENLGPNVNGPKSEHTSIPTPDGRSLYVTSDRPDGYGRDDIYITMRNPDNTWGPLVNLGPEINGTMDDRCPAWTPDAKIFLFDSVRGGGFESRDIWWVDFDSVVGYPAADAPPSSASAADS